MTSTTGSDKKLPAIQVLRGVAASLVVFYHYAGILGRSGAKHSWLRASGFDTIGASGVDLFFVISGFIMVITTRRKAGPADSLAFMKRRVIRIFPVYWIWSTIWLAMLMVARGVADHRISFPYIVDSYLLIPRFNGTDFTPLLARGWTLSFEMLFYAVFSCTILLGLKRTKLPFLVCAFALLFALGHLLPLGSGIRYLVTSTLILEFLYGVLVAEALLRLPSLNQVRWPRALPTILIGLGAIALLFTRGPAPPDALRFVVWGAPAFLIVSGAAMLGSTPCPRVLVYLGDASYSIYLAHGIIASILRGSLARYLVKGSLPPDAVIVLASVATIAICAGAYPLIERPIMDRLNPSKPRQAIEAVVSATAGVRTETVA